jgi:hypothetical protein
MEQIRQLRRASITGRGRTTSALAIRRCNDRRGIALASMLLIIILLSVLSLGAARLVTADFRRARDGRAIVDAANAADAGAYAILRDWASTPHEDLPVGGALPTDSTSFAGARSIARTARTAPSFFWTVSVGEAGDSVSRTRTRRTVAVAYRLAIPDLIVNAALTARDSISLFGNAIVSGSDTTLSAWGGHCVAGGIGAAVAMADTTRLCDGPCGAGSVGGRARGAPPLLADSGARDSLRYLQYGSESWTSLTSHAAIVLPGGTVVTPAPVVTAGLCDRLRSDNWGDPLNSGTVCSAYTPLIWARGDITLNGGVGQGVLLADGDVTLTGGAVFTGVIIARDDILTNGIGATVLGAVLAGDARPGSGDHSLIDGTATRIQRSGCAVQRALERSARIVPVFQRSWAMLR